MLQIINILASSQHIIVIPASLPLPELLPVAPPHIIVIPASSQLLLEFFASSSSVPLTTQEVSEFDVDIDLG